VRIDEAYREGLDVISITDHLEYRPYLQNVERLTGFPIKDISHNLSYELAENYAKDRGIMLIRGTEITRSMPPGHSNAIFITNADEMATTEYMDAFRAAKAQNAFIFWNHPTWLSQQPDSTRWWPEHTRLLEQGMMHGIEVVNGDYSPDAHRWCLEKKLTFIGNSDVHGPMQNFASGDHRTMTLVFVQNARPEDIHEALKARRTAIYHKEYVIGEEVILKELFENALDFKVTKTGNINQGAEEVRVTITNKSDLSFRLKPTDHDPRLVYFRNTSIAPVIIRPNGVYTFTVRLLNGIQGGDVNFIVDNFLVQPNTGMKYTLKI
jgi:hypothetical protein